MLKAVVSNSSCATVCRNHINSVYIFESPKIFNFDVAVYSSTFIYITADISVAV